MGDWNLYCKILIIKQNHVLGNHSTGTNQTLSSKYWIIAAREVIIKWEQECGVSKIGQIRMLYK